MRSIWLLGLLGLGCGDKDTETGLVEADTDTDTDADTDTDTDTDTTPEDCSDGIDNDGDGLVDCEDEDCLDSCAEDCADSTDNDGDGLTDCDDDECYGVGDCAGPYAMEMQLTFDYFEAYYVHDYYYPSGNTISKRAYVAANRGASNTGAVSVSGSPNGWDGPAISCSGQFTLFLGLGLTVRHPYYGNYFGAESLSITDAGLAFDLALSTDDSSLSWQGACPLSMLPVVPLGHPFATGDLLYNGKPWYVAGTYDYGDGLLVGNGFLTFFNYNNLFDVTSEAPLTWQGTY